MAPGGRLRVLLVEPFFGGSHRAFAEGLARHSRHRVDRVAFRAELWKWRLRAGALAAAERVARHRPDVLLISSLLDAAHLLALLGAGAPPAAAYFHESQLGYPQPGGKNADVQLGIANIVSALSVRRAIFNSRFHRDDFLRRLPGFLRRLPPPRPRTVARSIRHRSRVIPPGVELPPAPSRRAPGRPPVILWNHRWEFDKNPGRFFRVCYRLRDRGVPFRLVLLGESSQFVPKPFLLARERMGERILRFGWAPRRGDYERWLGRADIVVSTAGQENFGIAVVEAIAAGCYPLLPRALAYPEVLPPRLHHDHLYRDTEDLAGRLERLLGDPEKLVAGRADRRRAMERYSWERVAPRLDRLLEQIAATG